MKGHLDENHSTQVNGQKQLQCPYCDYTTNYYITSLRKHLEHNHDNHLEKKYFCSVCQKGKDIYFQKFNIIVAL